MPLGMDTFWVVDAADLSPPNRPTASTTTAAAADT